MLAEAVATTQHEDQPAASDPTHRLRPHIDSWAAELDLTGPDARSPVYPQSTEPAHRALSITPGRVCCFPVPLLSPG